MHCSDTSRLSPGRRTILAVAVAAALSSGATFAVPSSVIWTSGDVTVLAAETVGDVTASGTLGTLNNSGTITDRIYAVYNRGTLTALNNTGGMINSDIGTAVSNDGTIGTLRNSGAIQSGGSAVYNTATLTQLINEAGGTLSAGDTGIYNSGAASIDTLSNSGMISASGDRVVVNFGQINALINTAGGTFDGAKGVIINSGTLGVLDNQGGTLHGGTNAISNSGSSARIDTLNNSGVISSANMTIANSSHLGQLNNSGVIKGVSSALYNWGSLDTLINTGVMSTSSTQSGSTTTLGNVGSIGSLSNAGTISGITAIHSVGAIGVLENQAGGTLAGNYAISSNGHIDAISNKGLISATSTAIYNGNGASLGIIDNTGVISASTALSNTRGATLGAIRNTGTLTGNIDNQGQLGAISNTGTLAGDITNTGVISTLTNTSTGTLGAIVNMETGRLAGGIDNAGLINARTAILNVGSGSLGAINNAGTIAGDIQNRSDNALIINGHSGSAFGVLTGFGGGLTQADKGTVFGINNDVRFTAGRLLLNDDIWMFNGHSVVNSGATLQVNNALLVSGNYAQAGGAGLIFGVADSAVATGNPLTGTGFGQLSVTGSVTLARGTSVGLARTGSAYGFAQGQRYLVIRAANGADTYFNQPSLTYTLDAPGLSLTGQDVAVTGDPDARALVLTVVGSDGASHAINGATTYNSRASLGGLFRYEGTDAQLMNLSRAGAAQAAAGNQGGAQLSPAATAAAASSASVASTGKVVELLGTHLDTLRGGAASGVASGESSNGKGLWGQAYGGNARQDQRDDVAGYHADYHGMLLGADAELNDRWRAGGLFSYTRTSVNNDGANRHNSADITSYGLIGYATYTAEPWYVNVMAGAVQHQYDTKRQISISGFDGTAKGDYDGMQYLAAVQAGYPIDLGASTTLTPIAGLSYSTLKQDSYSEQGGNGAALRVESDDLDSFKSDLGAKLERSFATGYGELIPAAQLTWRHEFRDQGLRSVANYVADVAGETRFGSKGPSALRDTGVLGLGVTLVRDDQLSLSAQYALEAGSGYTANTGNLQVRWDF